MLQGFILQLIKGFVLRQVQKYLSHVDWKMIKADAEIRIKALVPGEWLDDEAVKLVDKAIDILEKAAQCQSCVDGLVGAASLLAQGDAAGAKALASKCVERIWAEVLIEIKA